MTADPRARHLRRLNKLRRSARGWSVRAGLLGGAALVLVPYQGIGLPDAAWAAAAGGSLAIAVWRWVDFKAFSALPVPDPLTPELMAAQSRERMFKVVRKLPGGRTAVNELERYRLQLRMRGLAVAEPWRRLDRASLTLSGLAGRLGGPVADAVVEANAAERALRELGERTAGVERTMRMVAGDAGRPLMPVHGELLTQFTEGVGAYEQLVAAAAGYVAEDGRVPGPSPAVGRLTNATDLLRGISEGLSELRQTARP